MTMPYIEDKPEDMLAEAVWIYSIVKADAADLTAYCKRVFASNRSVWRVDAEAKAGLRLRTIMRRRIRECWRHLDKAFSQWHPGGVGH